MARPLRIEFEGAFYHVISRGNASQPVFLNDKEIPKNQRLVARPSLEQIFSKAGESKATRNALTYQAVRDYGYTLKEAGEFLGLHYSTVSKAFRKGREITKNKCFLQACSVANFL